MFLNRCHGPKKFRQSSRMFLPTVVKENHSVTRDRYSLNTPTDSNKERVAAQVPGFECMFKHAGEIAQGRLQAHVLEKQPPMKVTVVTGPSGSYREFDIIEFMEKNLVSWGPYRRWQIFMLDAYGPGLTRNVQNKAWEMGYVCITHGGGASQVLQTNDTDLHKPVRESYTELESIKTLEPRRPAAG